MCTLTMIPDEGRGGGARLAFNRDESRSRPGALPPELRRQGERRAVMPLDPVSGGTWIAVNDAGLAVALLNVSPPSGKSDPPVPAARGLRSRGSIIPGLLHDHTLGGVLCQALTLLPAEYLPFRLVLARRGEVAEVRSDGDSLRASGPALLTGPLLFTSSGLGDHLVEGPRRRLFERLFGRSGDRRRQQDAFHRHSWPERTHLSVCMRRPDARTVSHTALDLGDRNAVLTYFPGSPDRARQPHVVVLPLRQGGVP